MSYTPPNGDAVDFPIKTYTAPSGNAVNFELNESEGATYYPMLIMMQIAGGVM